MLTRGKTLTEELSYAACALDCEGSVTLSRTAPKPKQVNLHVAISIANTNKILVDFLHSTFGGNVYSESPRGLSKKVIYRWKIHSCQAAEFLRKVHPYVRLKRKQVGLALFAQNLLSSGRVLSHAAKDGLWQAMK